MAEVVRELVTAKRHQQSFRAGWRRPNRTGPVIHDHVTMQPSLIEQLRSAVVNRAAVDVTGQRQPSSSLPRFSADAFDRMEAIRSEVSGWCERLGIPSESARKADLVNAHLSRIDSIIVASRTMARPAAGALEVLRQAAAFIRSAVEPDLTALAERGPALDTVTLDALVRAADRWRTWCRIMAGWDTPAMRPYVPCPQCQTLAGERAGLRIRIDGASGTGGILDNAAVKAAVCLTCSYTWDAEQVGLLAAQLREAGQA